MKLTVATLLALPFLAAASPLEARQGAGSCDTGSMQCCNSAIASNSSSAGDILGLLGIDLEDTSGLLGLACDPLNVIGVGSGNGCTAEPVCCDNTQLGGVIGTGCLPVLL